MASRRRVSPELMRAFEASQVEPLDFETPGRVVDVPVPAEHFEQPQATAPAAPKSRFDVVREYLEQSRQPMPQPTTPEVDVRGAADFDNRRNLGQSMLAAGQAFTGNRRAMPQVTNAAEMQALGEREARKRELEQWAASRETQRTREAGLLSQALVEPSRKDPELEGRRLDNDRMRLEEQARHNQATEEDKDLDRDAKKKPKGSGGPVSADEVPFGKVVFKYTGRADLDKKTRELGQAKVRESAAKWNTTVAGLDKLETALSRFLADPTPKNKALLMGPALSAAGATNAAIGQGAMSMDEKNAQFQALGVSFGDAAGIQTLIERAFSDPQAAGDVVSRVKQMKELAAASVEAQAQPYGYSVKGADAPTADAPAKDGMVTVEDPENPGTTLTLSPAAAARLKGKKR